MAAYDVSFGSFLMNTGSYTVTRDLPIQASGPEQLRQPFAVREGSAVVQTRSGERVIQVNGSVAGADAATMQANRDALVLALGNGQQNLKVGYADERYYKARLMGEVTQSRLGGPLLWFYAATFLLADPFAYAASASQSAPGLVALT